jgi:hypothetical protein
MPINQSTRLTDSLERELFAQAIEEQLRPHPLRAVKKLIRSLVNFRDSARSNSSIHQMV